MEGTATTGDAAAHLHGKYGPQMAAQPILNIVVPKNPQSNSFGLVIGGGAPYCPCAYVTHINSPLVTELECGDEIIDINGIIMVGKSREEIAAMFKDVGESITINFRKLPEESGAKAKKMAFDIVMRKLKQKISDRVSDETLNLFGIHRAALPDLGEGFQVQLENFEKTRVIYTGLVKVAQQYVNNCKAVADTQQSLGKLMASMVSTERDPGLTQILSSVADSHDAFGESMETYVKKAEPILSQLRTFLDKVIPDAKLTQKKFEDAKHTYLAYCLKIHEMCDKEVAAEKKQEALPRMQTGNYEYRFTIRDCLRAKIKFEKLKNDFGEKLQILDAKHARDLCEQLSRLTLAMEEMYEMNSASAQKSQDEIADVVDTSAEQCTALSS